METASRCRSRPGPTGQAVVTGNGINYNGGPVLKGNPVPDLHYLVRQLERHGTNYDSHDQFD